MGYKQNSTRPYTIAMLAALTASSLQASVTPPLHVSITGPEEIGANGFSAEITTKAPDIGHDKVTQIRLTLEVSGVAESLGESEWIVDAIELGREYTFDASIKLSAFGAGEVKVQAESLDARGLRLWGRSETLFILNTPDERLHGKSSVFELKREKLSRDLAKGKIDSREHDEEFKKLVRGEELNFEKAMREEEPDEEAQVAPLALKAVPFTFVSGRVTYTQRIGRAPGDVFAAPADALPVRQVRVRFFDRNGATTTELASNPTTVETNDTGSYSATVPGMRVDGTAVNLVVRIEAVNSAVRVGPAGQRATVYSTDSPPVTVTSATTSVDMLVSNANLTGLRIISLLDSFQTSYDFVVANNASTGVGANPLQIFVEFPGTNNNGSFFSTTGDDHLNIGRDHAFDWDVLTHEYGHYVQKINNTTQNPGGCHYINANNTNFNQSTCGGSNRVLTKQQAISLAWGEGWPTFFGTNLQIASGAGALGIFSVADTFYTDTANNFAYDLEGNVQSFRTGGEDNEASVQRILWDFADALRDGHDELTYGTQEMWRELAGDPTIVTLDAFRAEFDGMVPGSPAGYSTGSVEQNRAKAGRVYHDLEVGPEPILPADNVPISATPPMFQWRTKGAKSGSLPAPGYRFNRFRVLFFTADYSQLIFTSPDITTTGTQATASWQPTAAEWATITASAPSTLTNVIKWVVEGEHDLIAPATGPYRGLDRSLGAPTIAFVVDDTGSMAQEINGVRTGLTQFIAALPAPELIEFLTFKDDVTTRIISDDLAAVQSVVSGLFAFGGGDCPEASAEALLEAAQSLAPGSSIIFATDASPHAGFDLTAIINELANRGITVSVMLTSDCVSAEPKMVRAWNSKTMSRAMFRRRSQRQRLPTSISM